MLRKLLPAVMLVVGLGAGVGCYSGEAEVGYTATYSTPAPALAYVSPGVSVVYDYDYPVFYADGFYWRNYGGYWYRSTYWNRGWAVSGSVPVAVRSINRPQAFTHYRGGYIVRRGPAGRAVVRDHRHRY